MSEETATICQVNQNSDSMYGALEGRIRLHRGDIEIGIVETKGAMGAWALMDDDPRVANAEVVEDAKLLRIDKDDFIDLLSDHVEITQGLLRTLTKRLHGLRPGRIRTARGRGLTDSLID